MQYEPKAVEATPDKPITALAVGDTFVATRRRGAESEVVGAFTVKKVTRGGFVHARGRDLVRFDPKPAGRSYRAVPLLNKFPLIRFKGGTGAENGTSAAWEIKPESVRSPA